MGLVSDYQQFFSAWFGSSPKNAVHASKIYSFSGAVSDGDTITCGSEIYEIDTNGSITTGHIAVDVSDGGTGAANAKAKFIAAVLVNSSLVTATSASGNTVTVAYVDVGTEGNDLNISKSMVNGSWAGGATKLSGGLYATPSKSSKAFLIISGVWYIATKPIDKYCEDGWKSFSPSLVS